jgi:hypothetical protein
MKDESKAEALEQTIIWLRKYNQFNELQFIIEASYFYSSLILMLVTTILSRWMISS